DEDHCPRPDHLITAEAVEALDRGAGHAEADGDIIDRLAPPHLHPGELPVCLRVLAQALRGALPSARRDAHRPRLALLLALAERRRPARQHLRVQLLYLLDRC